MPIVSVHRKDYKPGGAANVALNLAGLGANVTLIGIVGKDENNEYLRKCFTRSEKIKYRVFESESRPTSIKTRIIADRAATSQAR